jgi:polyhydroxybutyrate depolymerase
VNGKTRNYILLVPKGYDDVHPLPLVMMLHGYTGNAESADFYTGLGVKAQKEHFLLVLPDGMGKPQGWNCSWIKLGGPGADDVTFLTQLLNTVEGTAKVDTRREFVVGHSNGAFMTYELASKLAGRIAAIGVVAGTIGVDRGSSPKVISVPAHPVSAIILHSRVDQTVPYNHGPGLLSSVVSAPDSAHFWAMSCGIRKAPDHKVLPAQAEEDIYKGPKGVEVDLYSFAKGSHDWMGGFTLKGPEKDAGWNATDLIWDFLKAHPLPK